MTRNSRIAELLDAEHEAQRFRLIGDLIRQDAQTALAMGEQLLSSREAKERALGADLLGQLVTVAPATRAQIAGVLLGALNPQDDGDVVASFAIALGHAADPRAREILLSLSGHRDSDVRFAIAFALPALGLDAETIQTLRLLSRDADPAVRDWATFALAESDLTDEETRRTLLARASDADADTRAEAIYGLARRRDPLARELIERELASHPARDLILRARDELMEEAPSEGEGPTR